MAKKLDKNETENIENNNEKELNNENIDETETTEDSSKKSKKFQNQAEQVIDDVISTVKEKGEELSKSINSYSASRARPLVDLIETEEKYILKAEINNVNKDDIDLEVTSKLIEIKVKYNEEELEEGKYLIKEITKGEVTRKILLKNEINVESISAEFNNNF
jgi:HSP20 family molecular chaperone IbpA